MLRAALQALRPLAHANIAPPLLFGQALAWSVTGRFTWHGVLVAHAFGLLDHAFIVLTNDLADRDDDAKNTSFNLFSGGSRVLPEGRLRPRDVRAASIAAGAGLLSLGLASGPTLALLALAALALLLAYSGPPRLSHHPLGGALQTLGVGVVLPLVGLAAQAGSLDATPWARLLPSAALAFAGHVLTALPDAPADAAVGKRTWVVLHGEAAGRATVLATLALGLGLGAWLMPSPSLAARLAATLVPALALALAAALSRRAAARGRALLAFMVAAGASSSLALAAWTLLLAASRG